MRHNIIREAEKGLATSVTVFHKGHVYVAGAAHLNFPAIIGALETGADPQAVLDLFDLGGSIARRFRAASRRLTQVTGWGEDAVKSAAEKIEVRHGQILWDDQPVHGALADTILAYYRTESEDFLPLVRFMSNIMDNPNAHSRSALYDWMKHLNFNIDDEGYLLAYKGVRDEGNGVLLSINQGSGIVNGEPANGCLRNDVGNVVTMPRESVEHNPAAACSTGLHVGTWDYAFSYGNPECGGSMIEVRIHPRDIVSVPTDSDGQKMRCCGYTVVRVLPLEELEKKRPGMLANIAERKADALASQEYSTRYTSLLTHEDEYCESCGDDEVYSDGLCSNCYTEDDEDDNDYY